jgi:predicted N-acetyltransferase YhbS
MSTTRPPGLTLTVRDAQPSDHPAIHDVLLAAYREYAAALPPAVFDGYLADILDLDGRARDGRLVVAEHHGQVVGTVTWYDDAAAEGIGWPTGWAGVRALGVDPAMRGRGVGKLLMRECLKRARAAGAAVLCLHTAEFMTTAVAMYLAMGFRRVPAFDFDAASQLRLDAAPPVRVIAFRLDLTQEDPHQ